MADEETKDAAVASGNEKPLKRNTAIEIAPGKYVGENHPCFIIAEIGQNHQGDLQLAKQMIRAAANCGVDCVKFQKSDMRYRFTKEVLQLPYPSKLSFGETYGEHRKHLEFTEENFVELKHFADEIGVYFTASGTDKLSFDFLNSLGLSFFKVGSADTTNLPLLRHISKYQKPLVISTGMSNKDDVYKMYSDIFQLNKSIVLLQCTSSYPTQPYYVNLNVIKTYRELFPSAVIGYSGHEWGTEISLAAVVCGAKVIERHFTLDHFMKGTDHMASLTPEQLTQLVSGIKRIEIAMGSYEKKFENCEWPCFEKLGKTIVATRCLKSGSILSEDMIDVKVATSKGFDPIQYDNIIGKKLTQDLKEDDVILPNYIEEHSSL